MWRIARVPLATTRRQFLVAHKCRHQSSSPVEVVTRLGPSSILFEDGDDVLGAGAASSPTSSPTVLRSRPLTGVFTTRRVKKFTPLYVLPQLSSSSHGSTSSEDTTAATDFSSTPYLENLLHASCSSSVPLQHFLALRHSWGCSAAFYINTLHGHYLLTPSWSVGRDTPAAELSRRDSWERAACRSTEEDEGESGSGSEVSQAVALQRHRHAMASLLAEASPAAEWERIREGPLGSDGGPPEDGDYPSNGEEGVDGDEEEGEVPATQLSKKPQSRRRSRRRSRGQETLAIPEQHLFHINDGVQWTQPSSILELLPMSDSSGDQPQVEAEAVAKALEAFFQHHLARIRVYEGDGGWGVGDREAFLAEAIHDLQEMKRCAADGEELPTELEAVAFSERLFDIYTAKANVQFSIIDEEGSGVAPVITLLPLKDLAPGTELCLQYGREWWTTHFMQALWWWWYAATYGAHPLTPQTSAIIRRALRRAEMAATAPSDVFVPFPVLAPRRMGGGGVVLYHTAAKRRATHREAVAFAVMHSLVFPGFLTRLLQSSSGSNSRDGSAEVPIRRFRKALLAELEQRSSQGRGSMAEAAAPAALALERLKAVPKVSGMFTPNGAHRGLVAASSPVAQVAASTGQAADAASTAAAGEMEEEYFSL